MATVEVYPPGRIVRAEFAVVRIVDTILLTRPNVEIDAREEAKLFYFVIVKR